MHVYLAIIEKKYCREREKSKVAIKSNISKPYWNYYVQGKVVSILFKFHNFTTYTQRYSSFLRTCTNNLYQGLIWLIKHLEYS